MLLYIVEILRAHCAENLCW